MACKSYPVLGSCVATLATTRSFGLLSSPASRALAVAGLWLILFAQTNLAQDVYAPFSGP